MLRLLFATSEVAPLVKTGGLADVAAALPAALHQAGVDVRVLLPAYGDLLMRVGPHVPLATLPATPIWPAVTLHAATLPTGIPLWLIEHPALYARTGGPYQDSDGRDHPDNARRFGLLGHVAASLAGPASPLAWHPDVLHCNDWQTGLAPAYLHHGPRPCAASVMTIHNLAFQGVFDGNQCAALGLPPHAFGIEGVEYYGKTSFLKAGLVYAQALTTVSPTYAQEIQHAPLGFGLEGLLASRRDALTGILNGVDVDAWNPATDRALCAVYDAHSLAIKSRVKAALQQEVGLVVAPGQALLGMVSRLGWQKGSDLVAELAPRLAAQRAQLVVVGRGDPAHEQALTGAAAAHPGAVAFIPQFDEALAHRVEAGADAFLMPSRFEPCGLNQMYSQRYGTPPIAHATGGLVDSIVDATPPALATGRASGFLFAPASLDALDAAVRRMLGLYATPRRWRRLQQSAMARDFSWSGRTGAYLDVYRRAQASAG